MKRKALALSCAVILSCTLSSCQLKNMVNGDTDTNTEDTTTINTTDNTETTESNETNDAITSDSSDVITSNQAFQENKESSNDTISSESDSSLETIDSSVNRNCRIFYFNGPELKSYYVDTDVTVVDNAFVTALTSKLYESPNSSSDFLILPEEVGVSSAMLDVETGILKVTFNENFTNLMSLGTGTESGLISSIVNTYGYNYGVDKVAIYFGDELYTGLKGELPEGYYTVNYTDSVELN